MLIGGRHSYGLDLTVIVKDFGKGETQSNVLGAVAQVHILDHGLGQERIALCFASFRHLRIGIGDIWHNPCSDASLRA